MRPRNRTYTFPASHPLLSFTILSLVLTGLFFYRAFLGESYSGASNLFNDSLYRSAAPEGWRRLHFGDPSIYCQHLPWDLFGAQSVRQGEIPLWNPYSGVGAPFLANWQSTVFSPLKIPLYLFPSVKMFELLLLFKVFLGSLFAFLFAHHYSFSDTPLLLRRICPWRTAGVRGVAPGPLAAKPTQGNGEGRFIASTIAGLSFGFGGSIICSLRQLQLNTFILCPLLFLAVHRLCRTSSITNAAWTSLATALLLLSGHPEATAFTLLGGAVYGVVSVLTDHQGSRRPERRGSVLRKGIFLLTAFGGGALISSITLLPFLEFLFVEGFSYRTFTSLEYTPVWSFLVRLVFILLPDPVTISPSSYFLYGGIIPVAFSVYSLKHYREHLPLLSVLLLGAGFVCHLPPMSLLAYLPILRYFSSTYAICLVSLPLAVLAGQGVKLWLQREREENGLSLRAVGAGILGILCVLAASVFIVTGQWTWSLHLYISLFFSLIVIVIGSRRNGFSRYGLVPIVVLDLFLTGITFNAPGPIFTFPETEAIRWLKSVPGVFRVMGMEGSNNIPNTGLLQHIADVREINPIFPKRYVKLIYLTDPNALYTFIIVPRVIVSRFWDLMNVRFLIRCRCRVSLIENELSGIANFDIPYKLQWHSLPRPPTASFTKAYEDDHVAIYENRRVLPRAFIVHQALFTENEDASYRFLARTALDFRKVAILEVADREERRKMSGSLLGSNPTHPSDAEILTYTPMKVTIKARLSAPGVLVLGDAYYPGWKVSVDGQEGRIFPADYIFRGVALPPGVHTVTFSYRPRSFRIGLAVSLSSLILCWGGFIIVSLRGTK